MQPNEPDAALMEQGHGADPRTVDFELATPSGCYRR